MVHDEMPTPDLTLRSGGCSAYYMDTSRAGVVSYELYGMQHTDRCPDCGSENLINDWNWGDSRWGAAHTITYWQVAENYFKCMDCGVVITMEYVANKIITSG